MITEKQINKLVEIIQRNSVVCDSVMKCEGWEENARLTDALINKWKYCPWCGKEIVND